ncbi:MAG: phosphoglycerate dehydrogenase [Lachnospiraceae bacterium]|nr:phosphoglycerate dehydrogenase [Lachnospiraceae bacterium]
MYKIHCMNNIAKVGTDKLGSKYVLTENLEEADAIMVRSAKLHDTQFPKNLIAISRAGAGVNNIPLDRCAKEGIVVFNTPGANANAVKEMVILGMLLACRDIYGGITWVKDNYDDPDISKKAESAKKQFSGTEIAGKTLGVIGLGAIGAMVANAARSLGMTVLGYDPFLSINSAWSLDRHVKHVMNIEDIYADCDFITIHIPATPDTKGMISREAIEKMKDGVVFLNFARDSLVDEQAMAEALSSGHVAHYISDFANSISASMENAIVTPHLGASTNEAEDNCAVMAAKELKDFIECGNIENSVNFPRVNLGPITSDARLAIMHKNVPNMIGKITGVISDCSLNIENMSDKSRGEYAYALIDITGKVDDEMVARLSAIPDVGRVRLIRK